MREGLDAPTFELPEAKAGEIRAFLDGQSRIELAVWVRHEHQGIDGPRYDHHLMLGVVDDDWATGDMRALEEGMRLPSLGDLSEPTWVDIYPRSEVEGLRSFGSVLWEQTSPGDDPLDYRFTFEPFEPDPEAVARFAARLAELPTVRRVGADVARLWKGGEEINAEARLVIDAPFEAAALGAVADAARSSVLAGWTAHSAEIGTPHPAMTILYEADG